ncbi:HipA family kinase [Deinococcus fonticola]|uniref:HipA family kinase n=1 Tax=Deinococcus fonticola TaxID=2528713 RepID=UPI0010750865|nr:HipA family kinase [Deinococcus fonticola]
MPKAESHVDAVGRGGSKPQRFLLDSGLDLCAVKFQQCPQGHRVLCNEWLGHNLAQFLGVRVPRFGLVQVPAEALPPGGLTVLDPEDQPVALQPGIHFYSQWLEPATELTPSDLVMKSLFSDIPMLAGVILLDMLMDNWDRELSNPNLLVSRHTGIAQIYMVDTGNAFGSPFWGLGDLNPAYSRFNNPDDPLPYYSPHLPLLRAINVTQDFAPFLHQLSLVDRTMLTGLVNALPSEWGVTVTEGEALVNFLDARARQIPAHMAQRLKRREWWK